ncbi:hypothetical protein H4582DRAFT_130199 [Lactarius indigo]|nr:hypothetical protein H4582DRAFT_130199 [Lactarius indigo]
MYMRSPPLASAPPLIVIQRCVVFALWLLIQQRHHRHWAGQVIALCKQKQTDNNRRDNPPEILQGKIGKRHSCSRQCQCPRHEIPRKSVAQGGRPLKRQPTGVPKPAGQSGSRPKRTTVSRKLHKERSMRIPAIENDLMNRIGVSKKRKAIARATSTKTGKPSSPYKSLLVGIARTEDGSHTTSDSEGTSESSSHLVRCESPSPLCESPTSPLRTRSASPQPPELSAAVTGAAEAKGKKQRITPQSTVVLRPLPSRAAASSSHRAGSPTVQLLSRTPQDSPTTPELRQSGTRSLGASSSPRPRSSPRKRSPLAIGPPVENFPSVPAPMAAIPDDRAGSTAQSTKVQEDGVGAPHVGSSEESDSQSEDLSISDATSHESERIPDVSAANVAQAAAMKQSLLCQIEGRNEGGKWDDLQGFLHSLAPSEICGLLRTATRAGRRALRRLAGKETADSGDRKEEDDTRVLGSRAQVESVSAPDDAGSDGEEVMTQTIVPPRRSRFLYKAKGKGRARSPSPPLSSSPSPVFVFQGGAAASSSRAPDCLPTRKRLRTPESDDDDNGTSEPPPKRQKKELGKKPRPLRREGAFLHYPAPLPAEDTDQNDDAEGQTVHVNLIKSFLDQVQDFDVSGWLSRSSGITPRTCDPFAARDDDGDGDGDEFAERRGWTMRAELHDARRRRRGARVDDDATRRPALGSTRSYAVSRT